MKKVIAFKNLAIIAVALVGANSTAQAAPIVYTPVSSGQASGSNFFSFQNGFDAQPALSALVNNQAVVPAVDALGANPERYAVDAQGFINFGASFSSVEIVGLWTAYRWFSAVPTPTPFTDLWWSDTNSNVRGAVGTYTDINPALFNFATQPMTSGNTVVWTQDFDYTSSPVTVARQYLILSGDTGWGGGNRVTEFAITVVPEPTTSALVGLALVSGLVARRRVRGLQSGN